jgi:hypothetical protein
MFARQLLETMAEFAMEVATPLAVIGAAALIVTKAIDHMTHASERRARQATLEHIRKQQAKLNAAPAPKPLTPTHVVATKALPPIATVAAQQNHTASHSSSLSGSSSYWDAWQRSYNFTKNYKNAHKIAKLNAELEKRNKILEIQANARKLRKG